MTWERSTQPRGPAMKPVLHSFGGSGDGTSPDADLVYIKSTLYGTTDEGGARKAVKFHGWQGWKDAIGDGVVVFSWQ